MEEFSWHNCRNRLYLEEGDKQRINRRKISGYLRKLKESGDYYKIKHIKRFYQIYTILYQIKSLIYSKDTFEFNYKTLSIDDFSDFLVYIIDNLKYDIITFIDIMQDDNFNNEKLIKKNLDEHNERIFYAYIDIKPYDKNYITN